LFRRRPAARAARAGSGLRQVAKRVGSDVFDDVFGNPPDEDMATRTLFDRAIEEAGVTGGTIAGALLFRRFGRKRLARLHRQLKQSDKISAKSKSIMDAIEAAARLRNAQTVTGAVLGAASGGMAGEYGSNQMRKLRKKGGG
jgi:hypothetical protein